MSRKQVFILGLTLSLVFVAIVPAMAQNATPEAPAPVAQPTATAAPLTASTGLFATANLRVNVRSGPGTKYTVLGQVRAGDALDITGQLANNSWLRVNFNGQEGWVSSGLFEITGDVTIAPQAEAGPTAVLRQTANQALTAKLGEIVATTNFNANLRTGPSASADVLTIIPFNTQLTVLARTAASNWLQVNFNNQTGWISAGTLFISQGNLVNAPQIDENGNIVQPAAQPAPQATPAP
jgi:uncharacterized protein YraI